MRDDTTTPAVLERSAALRDRCLDLIPGCAQTNSKAPSGFVQGITPTHVERGEGSHVWDVDGNEYVDHPMGRGPVVLGHGYPEVADAVADRARAGTAFSLPHPLQVEVAERIRELVPAAERVRFAKNGHDATALSSRLARAYTDRDVIATQGYHGWSDVWMGEAPGVPDAVAALTESFAYNDLDGLERIFAAHPDDVAGVVMTPVAFTPPEDGFLEGVRDLCDEHGAVLVFDEVVTGFRLAPGGAGEFFGVDPDLVCFAKAVANGFPLAGLAGRGDVMDLLEEEVYFSLTYGGEAVGLAAAAATLSVMADEPVHDRLFETGRELRDGYNRIAAEAGLGDRTDCAGYPPLSTVRFDGFADDTAAESLFMQECIKRGVLFDAIHLPSYSHTDSDVAYTLDVYRTAMAELADAVEAGDVAGRLEGTPVGTSVRDAGHVW